MTRKFYAVDGYYGLGFAFRQGQGYTVKEFRSKRERDEWVKADPYTDGKPRRESVTAKEARNIDPDRFSKWWGMDARRSQD